MLYVDYAKNEFAALGYKPVEECEEGPNKWMQENILELLEVVDKHKQGHSGTSIQYLINMFSKLALFKPLSPLTGDDSEWEEVAHNLFQNKRCSHVFKNEKNIAHDIEGYIFWSWSTRDLQEDEKGYPGIRKFKSSFMSNMGRRLVTFPYIPKSTFVEVDCYEVNKDTDVPEEGSGWWKTIYPDYIIKEHDLLLTAMEEEE